MSSPSSTCAACKVSIRTDEGKAGSSTISISTLETWPHPRRGGRIGLRQVHADPRHPRHPAARRRSTRRDLVRGREPAGLLRGRAATHACAPAASASSRRTRCWRSIRCSRSAPRFLRSCAGMRPTTATRPSAAARIVDRLLELLRRMQVPDPESALERYPHQFSGGQRQRLLIAAALACAAAPGDRRRADHGARRHDPAPDPAAAARAGGANSASRCCSSPTISASSPSSATSSASSMPARRSRPAPARRDPRRAVASLYAGAARLPSRPRDDRSSASRARCRRRCRGRPGCLFAPRCRDVRPACRRRRRRRRAGPGRGVDVRCVQYRMTPADPSSRATCSVLLGGRKGFLRRSVPPVQRGERRQPRPAGGEILGARRRVRLRQDHARPHHPWPAARKRGRDPARWPRVGGLAPEAARRRAQAPSSTSTRMPARRSTRGGASAGRWRRGS